MRTVGLDHYVNVGCESEPVYNQWLYTKKRLGGRIKNTVNFGQVTARFVLCAQEGEEEIRGIQDNLMGFWSSYSSLLVTADCVILAQPLRRASMECQWM
jgi:hypothetical protein